MSLVDHSRRCDDITDKSALPFNSCRSAAPQRSPRWAKNGPVIDAASSQSDNPAVRMDSTRCVASAGSLKGSFATRRVTEKFGFKFKHSLARVAARPLSANLAWQPAMSAETQYPRVGKCSNAAKASSCRFTRMRASPSSTSTRAGRNTDQCPWRS